jgi:hypothetical protein
MNMVEQLKMEIYLQPLFQQFFAMDIKKLDRLENIRNFLENDNVGALNRYIEKIRPLVSKDEDFQELFKELSEKNYDRALLVTEDIIYEMKGTRRDDESDDYNSLDDFEVNDDFMYDESDPDFSDLDLDTFEEGNFFDDQDDDFS